MFWYEFFILYNIDGKCPDAYKMGPTLVWLTNIMQFLSEPKKITISLHIIWMSMRENELRLQVFDNIICIIYEC